MQNILNPFPFFHLKWSIILISGFGILASCYTYEDVFLTAELRWFYNVTEQFQNDSTGEIVTLESSPIDTTYNDITTVSRISYGYYTRFHYQRAVQRLISGSSNTIIDHSLLSYPKSNFRGHTVVLTFNEDEFILDHQGDYNPTPTFDTTIAGIYFDDIFHVASSSNNPSTISDIYFSDSLGLVAFKTVDSIHWHRILQP